MIGTKGNRTALQYKRFSSMMSRVADSHLEKQGSKPTRASFFFFFCFKDNMLRYFVVTKLKALWCKKLNRKNASNYLN